MHEVLSRDLYRGIITWNKSRKRDTLGQHRATVRRPIGSTSRRRNSGSCRSRCGRPHTPCSSGRACSTKKIPTASGGSIATRTPNTCFRASVAAKGTALSRPLQPNELSCTYFKGAARRSAVLLSADDHGLPDALEHVAAAPKLFPMSPE